MKIYSSALSLIIKKNYRKTSDLIFTGLIFFFSLKKNNISNNVLIVIPDGLGDNILRLEVIKKYFEYFKSKRIYIIVTNENKAKEKI